MTYKYLLRFVAIKRRYESGTNRGVGKTSFL